MIYVFLADGFEEIEAVAPIDILRRAGFDDVITVKVGDYLNDWALGGHDIEILPDIHENEIDLDNFAGLEMIVLPGGGVGVENLYNSDVVKRIIKYFRHRRRISF